MVVVEGDQMAEADPLEGESGSYLLKTPVLVALAARKIVEMVLSDSLFDLLLALGAQMICRAVSPLQEGQMVAE